jgi:1-acyl-sn-glycerol-3-phosphate acyltransferase
VRVRWPVIALRSLLTWAVGVVVTVVCAGIVIAIALAKDTSPWIERVIRFWSRVWIVISGTDLEIEGQENVDLEQSYVVVSNHLSTLDIMACFLAVRLPIRYLAKKELFGVPILAQAMRAVGIIEVDRSARSAVHAQVNKQAAELIAKGRSLIIYAEGTRPRNGVMKSFKKGAFTMAIASQLPILPVSIHGTYEAMPPGTPWVRGGKVQVIVDPAISTKGMDHSNTGELRDRVYEIVSTRVTEMGGPVG